nr:hypothetical protein [Tanacetum cinerariifolium]
MTTLAKHIIVARAENHPPMVDKSMYGSWANRIQLFIKGKKHSRVMLDLIDNGPLVYPTVKEDGQTRPKKYTKLTEAQQLQVDCDIQATNIILHDLSPDVKERIRLSISTKQCIPICYGIKPKRPRSSAWFKEKLMLVEAKEAGQILDKEQLSFIIDHEITKVQVSQQAIPQNSAFQTKDLDAYDSDCDDISSAKAVLMAILSSCDSDVLSEVPYFDTYLNNMINQDMQEMSYYKQTHIMDFPNNEITNDNNILPYSQYLQESQDDDLNAQLQEKVFAIAALKNELRKLKGKNVIDTVVSKPIATIAPGMFKLDIEPISHRLKHNRDAHEVYLEKTIENTDTLRGLVECARKQNPNESLLESACMFTKHVQELLVYVSKTYHSLTKPCEKLVAITPMNKDKKVRFVKLVTSSSNIHKQTDYLRTKDSNKPLLTSIELNTLTSASGSNPSGNTKKNRISRPPSSNQKNKVEEHHGKVKSSLNKTNSVFKRISRTFTIVRNKCPLTRFTFIKVVPTKKTTNKLVLTPTQGIIVYSRRSKAPKLVGSSSKYKITESRISNSSDLTQSEGSTVFDVPSSFLNDCRLPKLFYGI